MPSDEDTAVDQGRLDPNLQKVIITNSSLEQISLSSILFLNELFINHFCIRHGPGGPGSQSRVCYEASLHGAQSSRRTFVHIQFTTTKVESVQWLEEI